VRVLESKKKRTPEEIITDIVGALEEFSRESPARWIPYSLIAKKIGLKPRHVKRYVEFLQFAMSLPPLEIEKRLYKNEVFVIRLSPKATRLEEEEVEKPMV
jgi:hypothetical protein